MEDMNKKLDQLFAQAKNEDPLLSFDEVANKIQRANKVSVFKKYSLRLMLGVILLSAGLIFFPGQNGQLNNRKIEVLPKIEKPLLKQQEEEYSITKNTESAQDKIKIESIHRQPQGKIDKIEYLELTAMELMKIGIEQIDDTLKVYTISKKSYLQWEVTESSNSVKIFNKNELTDVDHFNSFRLRHISRYEKGEYINAVQINYKDSVNHDLLIPIKVQVKKSQQSPLSVEMFIWYEPTPELIAKLPDRYRLPLQTEMASNQIETRISNRKENKNEFIEETSCGFFETFCRDISIFDRIKVFPNPASTHISAHFKTLEECQLSIDLINIEGRQVQNLFNGPIQVGPQRISLDVSGLVPDLYLLKFESSNGEYETIRVIIKR